MEALGKATFCLLWALCGSCLPYKILKIPFHNWVDRKMHREIMHTKSFSSTYKFFLLLLILEETENLLHPYKSHGPGPGPPAPTLASGTSRSWLLEVGNPASLGLRFLCTVTQHAAIRAGRASAAHRKIASFLNTAAARPRTESCSEGVCVLVLLSTVLPQEPGRGDPATGKVPWGPAG